MGRGHEETEHADSAEHAEHADRADRAGHAEHASRTGHASHADSTEQANRTGRAGHAEHASRAEHANHAGRVDRAVDAARPSAATCPPPAPLAHLPLPGYLASASRDAKNDMRWRRTERNLMAAMGAALAKRPIDKISVTALAAAADISKATFYLHYRDIYDAAVAYARQVAYELVSQIDYAQDYFDDPRRFVDRFIDDVDARNACVQNIVANGLVPVFFEGLADALFEAFERTYPLRDDRRGKIALTFVLHGLLAVTSPMVDVPRDEVKQVVGDLLERITAHVRHRSVEEAQGEDVVPRGRGGKEIGVSMTVYAGMPKGMPTRGATTRPGDALESAGGRL